MPIEIRELIITARVEDSAADSGPARRSRSSEEGRQRPGLSAREVEEIVERCLERITRMLHRKKER